MELIHIKSGGKVLEYSSHAIGCELLLAISFFKNDFNMQVFLDDRYHAQVLHLPEFQYYWLALLPISANF